MKLRAIRCDDVIWNEIISISKYKHKQISEIVRESLLKTIQEANKERFENGSADWYVARERKLQEIESMINSDKVDLEKLKKVIKEG